jgi:DNA excision repair protein ERCC-2
LYNTTLGHIRVPLTYSEILSWCEKNEICPYYYQLELIAGADVISVNYNYILNEPISWVIKSKVKTDEAFLVVDEAHNLQNAYANINTSKITINSINNAIKEVEENYTERRECSKFLVSIKLYLEEILDEMKKENVEDKVVEINEIIKKCARDYEEFEERIEEVKALGNRTREKKIREGKAPRSSLHALGNFFTKALELTSEEGVALIANLENKDNLSLEIFDMRSRELLSEVWDKYYRVIFCSGTLGPPKAFAETIGLSSFVYGEFSFRLRKENCISLITLELSSEGEELPEEMAKKYVEAIESFVLGLNENIAIFSASYRIQQDLIDNGLLQVLERNNRMVYVEEKGMSGNKSRAIIEAFKRSSEESKKGVLVATAGGRFSEGADFPGRQLVGVFLVGIPFDKISAKTKLYVDFYKKKYGLEKGELYSYIIPAIRRASQALGRALRSSEDRAVFVLGDRRYRNFLSLLPRFVRMNYKRIRNYKNIGKYAEDFFYKKKYTN